MHLKSDFKYYLMLLFVVVSWGCDPIVNHYLYRSYSAAALSSLATLASALTFLFLSRKKLHRLKEKRYLTVALPICLVNSLACVLQRIGLQYTSPAHYAFLEHLSCVAVPLILFFGFRKKPTAPQILASFICLVGCLLLASGGGIELSLNVGDALCAAAGILLGLGIVCTSLFTQGMDIMLFMTLHMCTYFLTSATLAGALHFIRVDGAPMERFMFSFSPMTLIFAILFGLFSVGICWLLRNEANRRLPPTAVAVIAPFAAVITALISVLQGIERATPSFILACILILAAAVFSGLGEAKENEKAKNDTKKQQKNP